MSDQVLSTTALSTTASSTTASSTTLPIIFSHRSDVGRVREHNEDCIAVEDPTDPDKMRLGRLFIVADGMGGYLAGEVASRLAVETILREYYAGSSDSADPTTRLQNAVQAANDTVYTSAHSDRSHAGMGTTLVATAIVGRTAYIASVGDSRAYVVHQGELLQITQDHSLVGEQIRAGLITKEQARAHPQRNVITRALGSQSIVAADMFEGELGEGDILVMCTDGLTGHVPDDRLHQIVTQLPPEQAVERLIELANQDGGTDNISVIVVRVVSNAVSHGATSQSASTSSAGAQPGETPSAATTSSRQAARAAQPVRKSLNLAWIAVGAVLMLSVLAAVGVLALGVGGWWLVKNGPTPAPSLAATVTLAPAATSLPVVTLTPTLPVPTPVNQP